MPDLLPGHGHRLYGLQEATTPRAKPTGGGLQDVYADVWVALVTQLHTPTALPCTGMQAWARTLGQQPAVRPCLCSQAGSMRSQAQ